MAHRNSQEQRTWRGTDNLRLYISQAVLPQMLLGPDAPPVPPDGHKSHRNHLTVRLESYRNLENIYQMLDNVFRKIVLDCEYLECCIYACVTSTYLDIFTCLGIDDHVPSEPLGIDDEDEETGERLSIPSPMCCNIPPLPLTRPSEISRYIFTLLFQQHPLTLHTTASQYFYVV